MIMGWDTYPYRLRAGVAWYLGAKTAIDHEDVHRESKVAPVLSSLSGAFSSRPSQKNLCQTTNTSQVYWYLGNFVGGLFDRLQRTTNTLHSSSN